MNHKFETEKPTGSNSQTKATTPLNAIQMMIPSRIVRSQFIVLPPQKIKITSPATTAAITAQASIARPRLVRTVFHGFTKGRSSVPGMTQNLL